MELVHNLNGESHWKSVVEGFAGATEIAIVSPFLDNIFPRLLSEAVPSSVTAVSIVTRIEETPNEALNSVRLLNQFLNWAERRPNLSAEIRINPALHGKIYLAKQSGKFTFGLIGSANCTNNGLIRNHEWGVISRDQGALEILWTQIQASLPKNAAASRAQLKAIAERATAAIEANKEAFKRVQAARIPISDILGSRQGEVPKENLALLIPSKATVWLKPAGDTKERISADEIYWADSRDLHFGKRPVSVRKGDLIIVYAVGWKQLVGAFEVTGGMRHLSDGELADWPRGERWPWAIPSRPLTPDFSRRWAKESLFLEDLVERFSSLEPSRVEREKASKLVNAIRAKNDKIRLMPGLAAFVLDELYRRNSVG